MYTTKEVADLCGVSLKTVQWWCREKWDGKKSGRDYLLSDDDLGEFLSRRKLIGGESEIVELRELTGRSLPTVYKVAKKVKAKKVDGLYVFTTKQRKTALELLGGKNDND